MSELDVRGLPPPGPFENIMHALPALPVGTTLRVLIHREPFPLYAELQGMGYAWQTSELPDGHFAILISRAQ